MPITDMGWLNTGMTWINNYMAKLMAMDMGSIMGLLAVLLGLFAIIFAFSQLGKNRV